MTEKPDDPPSDLNNTGAYSFPAEARDWLDVGESERGELELTDVLEQSVEHTTVTEVPLERWLDIGRQWEVLEANEWKLAELAPRIDGDVHEDADLRGMVVVEEGATIDAGVVIEGPTLIRSGAEVGPNASVRGHSLMGEDVHVGHAVEIKNSVLMAGSSLGHLSFVGDSILGREVNFGAGTTVANLRHDDEAIQMMVKGELLSTGHGKFGVVCGDEVKTGIQTNLNAGVKLGTGTRMKPNETVLRDQ